MRPAIRAIRCIHDRPAVRDSGTRPARRARAVRWGLSAAIALSAAPVLAPAQAGAAVGNRTVAAWEMDDGSRTLVDSSGNGLHGSVGAAVTPGVAVDGAVGLSFPNWGNRSVDPARLAVVGEDQRLDPGSSDWALTVRFRTTHATGNVTQKGQARTAGGFFKLETTDGRAYCVFRGPAGTVAAGSGVRVTDGAWHTVRCERVGGSVAIWVDGVLRSRRSGATGHIDNTFPLTIGGKPSCDQGAVGCDYFAGVIDLVRLERLNVSVPDAVAPSPSPAPSLAPAVVDPGPVVK